MWAKPMLGLGSGGWGEDAKGNRDTQITASFVLHCKAGLYSDVYRETVQDSVLRGTQADVCFSSTATAEVWDSVPVG